MSEKHALYCKADMPEPTSLVTSYGQTVVFTTRCPGKESENEDAAALLAGGAQRGVLVVADGMGGGAAGERASEIAIQAIAHEVGAVDNPELGLRGAILNGIESANQQILDLGIGAATTLAAVEVEEGVVRPYHVGDSLILVMGQRGKVKLETIAHAPVSQAVDAGVLDDQEAMHHEDRHLVSNILGTVEMRIEIGPPIRLSRFDTLLLASDGLFDNLSIEEVVSTMRKGPLQQNVASLVKAAHARMEQDSTGMPSKPDDLTIVAFRLNS
jgi:serine/threonine protein phosphatase PrpC